MFQMKVIFFLAVEKIYCWHSSVIFTYFHIYEFYDNIAKLMLFFFWLIHFFHLIWLPKTLWQMAALHISKYIITAWKVAKYGVISGPYFPVFGSEITPYLDTFQAVYIFLYLYLPIHLSIRGTIIVSWSESMYTLIYYFHFSLWTCN